MVIVIVVVAAFMIVIVIVVVIVVVTVVVVVVIVVVAVIAIVIVFVVTIVIVNVIVRGGILRGGNISLWEISYFKYVRNFPLNFQATVRNKPGAKFSHWGAFSLPLCSLAFELLSVGRGWRWPRNPDSLPGWRVSIRSQSTRTSRGGGKALGTQGSGSGIKESQMIRELVFIVPQSR